MVFKLRFEVINFMNAYKFRLTDFATSYTIIILAENKKEAIHIFCIEYDKNKDAAKSSLEQVYKKSGIIFEEEDDY